MHAFHLIIVLNNQILYWKACFLYMTFLYVYAI